MRVPTRRQVTRLAACSARTWAEVLPTGMPADGASASTLRSAWMSRSSNCRRAGLPSALPTRANWVSSAVLRSVDTGRILLFKCALEYLNSAQAPLLSRFRIEAGGVRKAVACRPGGPQTGGDAMTRIWPLLHEGLGNNSYLAEVAEGLALAVDPGRDPRPYLDLAAAHGLRVAFTADTHLHADFVSGSWELAGQGARLLAPAASGLSFGHEELRGGEDLDLGGLTLRALATPGHTPEHLSCLLLDGGQPVAVFTGGALIAGGVARTDLADPDRAEEWTRAAYRSARALLGLPGGLAAYPTHGPASFCSAGETGEHLTTIGRERTRNPLLAGTGENSFTRPVLEKLGSYPAYFPRMPP